MRDLQSHAENDYFMLMLIKVVIQATESWCVYCTLIHCFNILLSWLVL